MSMEVLNDGYVPPYDLEGKYYDELSQEDKQRYWFYYYGETHSLEEAEVFALNYFPQTLHFVCEINPAEYPWTY